LSKSEIQAWLHGDLLRASLGTTVEVGRFAVRRIHHSGKLNLVHLIADPGNELEAEIDRQIQFFQSRNQSFEWTVESRLNPPGLLESLERRGFEIGPVEKIVVRPITGLEDLPPSTRFRQVETESDLTDFCAVASTVFQKDYSLTTQDLRDNLDRGSRDHVAFLGLNQGIPVAVARLYSSSEAPIAGLYGAGTLPEFRGQGHYRDLITARAAIAHSRGSKLLRVDALPTSLPILLRCDFTAVGETWPCQWKPQTIAE
jgi:GNAT superfamily N-acetyltransferase